MSSKFNTSKPPVFPLCRIYGQAEMIIGLFLNIIDPSTGGIMIMGERGNGKSTVVRALVDVLPWISIIKGDPYNSSPYKNGELIPDVSVDLTQTPLIDLPLGATEDRICGTIDIEQALNDGVRAFEPGILAKANRGLLYVDEMNLLDDHLVDILLDAAAGGWNTVEREGVSIRHPAKFILIGSGNPEEGELRPQLLDRFGLYTEVKTVRTPEIRTAIVTARMLFDENPQKFIQQPTCVQAQEQLKAVLQSARNIKETLEISGKQKFQISALCAKLGIDGLRGDLVVNRAARSLAALKLSPKITNLEIGLVLALCLRHRLKTDPLKNIDSGDRIMEMYADIFNPPFELTYSLTNKLFDWLFIALQNNRLGNNVDSV